MKLFRAVLLLLLIGSIVALNFAQDTQHNISESEKEKAREEFKKKTINLIEQIVNEAAQLKVPDNRVLLQTKAANSLWSFDEKRSRALFEQAGKAIVELLNESETDDNGMPQNLYRAQEARRNLLYAAAARDAELALTLLAQTRPAIIDQLSAVPPNSQTSNNFSWILQNEAQLEQQFARQAAAQSPRRAAEVIRKSLATGVTYEVINTINQIKIKDVDLASELGNEVLNKLISADFAKQYDARSLSLSFFQLSQNPNNAGAQEEEEEAAENKVLKLNQQSLRELADKLAAFYLKEGERQPSLYDKGGEIENNLQTFEKFSATKAALLRRRISRQKQSNPQAEQWQSLNKLGDGSVDSILAEAPNFSREMEYNIYTMAADKAVNAGEEERALSIINRISSKAQRSSALQNYYWQVFHRAAQAKKFPEARRIALQSEKNVLKITLLVSLAKIVLDANDRDQAMQFLNEARTLIVDNPNNQDELQDYVAYVRGALAIDPDRTYNLLGVLVDNLNEMVAAYQTLSKFNNENQYFREGEVMLNNFSPQIWNYLPVQENQLKVLEQTNFERSIELANRFQRPELRLLVKTQVVQAALAGADKQNLEISGRTVRVLER